MMMRNKNKRQRGFSLIEVLVVIAIISLLSTILLKSVSMMKQHAMRTETGDLLHQVTTAWKAHLQSERKFLVDNPESVEEMDPTTIMHLNMRKGRSTTRATKLYFEPGPIECIVSKRGSADWQDWTAAGTGMLDSWGKAYLVRNGVETLADLERAPDYDKWRIRLMLDANGDGFITTPDGQEINQKIIAWSVGPDGIDASGDEIKSW